MKKRGRNLLIGMNGFLAATAIAGGVALIAGFQTPPVSLPESSPFRSCLLPGLALAVLVGGPALVATATLLRRNLAAANAALVAAAAVIVFEIVEIEIIGSPAGPARVM